jgi:lipoprotein-anchoring transpeptidase ErfK/SrfK
VKYRRYRTSRRGHRAAALLSLVLATVVAVGAGTQARGSERQSEGARIVAAGVTVAGVDLTALNAREAEAVLAEGFARPLVVRLGARTWRFAPQTFGARAQVRTAVRRALSSPEGTELRLPVSLNGRRLRAWARGFARDFGQPAKNARIVLRGLRPRATREHVGRRLDLLATQMRVAAALRAGSRDAVPLAVRRIRPRVTRAKLGTAIVIRRGSNRLYLYKATSQKGMRRVRMLGVATGQAAYPTPIGDFTIATMQRYPWWYPPDSDWAAGASPIPPGPGNPLGTRWMGLSEPLVGIHGTPDSASIGYSASHGCIRMHISDAEWLFERVRVGTPVFIVAS